MAEDQHQPAAVVSGEENRRPRRSTCCREMQLLEFPDKYVIRSADSPAHAFSVDRSDGLLHPLSTSDDNSFGTPIKVSAIYGVIGTIRLLAGTHVLVITSCKEIGSYLGFSVYCVTSMRFLSCNEGLKHSTSQEKSDEAYFMSLLRTVESIPGLYYSYEVDLSLNLQRACKIANERVHKPLWKQADPRFIWNRSLLEELIETKLDPFIIPLIQGSFQTVQFTLKDSPVKISLISRRCNRRLGTRMWRRGANFEGATANFIETEQLLEFEGFKSSFLQMEIFLAWKNLDNTTSLSILLNHASLYAQKFGWIVTFKIRGSIPLLWEQIVDLSYKPQINIINHDETPKVVERHFHDLIQRYGEIVALDLTDKLGDEGQLSRAYAAEMEKIPHVRYISFDFHHICGNANFEELQVLYEQISENVQDHGYFLVDAKGEILSEQKGIVRANCIDCLDRTNVTQSYLATKSLNSQLQRMGLFSSSEWINMYAEIYEVFKILWVEHGDQISLEYAGTHALKGDLVRYGRQTIAGLIKDGMSALSRYYLNNFQDGIRQDALDLISGRYTVGASDSPFQLNGFASLSCLPVASALIVGGLTASFSLNQAGRSTQNCVSSLIWVGLAAGVMAIVRSNGKQLCSRPRLCGLI